jgi:hypothetical protein
VEEQYQQNVIKNFFEIELIGNEFEKYHKHYVKSFMEELEDGV